MDIREKIEIHIVTDGEDQLGWVHTHGMEQWNLPNLEIRGVPLFLCEGAGGLINHVAQYMYDLKQEDRKIKLGETMQTGKLSTFSFVQLPPIPGDEAHFEHPMWALSDEPMRSACAHPGHA